MPMIFVSPAVRKNCWNSRLNRWWSSCLRERGLELSPTKTVITRIEDGFDFLGQTIRKYRRGNRSKFFITPSKKSVKAFLRKIRTRIKQSRDLTAGELTSDLNPLIRGWALY